MKKTIVTGGGVYNQIISERRLKGRLEGLEELMRQDHPTHRM